MNPEEFEDFLEGDDSQFNAKLEEYKERMIAQAIESNYVNICEKGISDWHIRHMDQEEIDQLNQTFSVMIDHFEQLEEYEKCAKLVKEQAKVKEILALKEDI